jgi:hypothetical protein
MSVFVVIREAGPAWTDGQSIAGRLADDPWTRTERLRTARVESWNVFVGADRLPALTTR